MNLMNLIYLISIKKDQAHQAYQENLRSIDKNRTLMTLMYLIYLISIKKDQAHQVYQENLRPIFRRNQWIICILT
jgi:hypothetical protein